MTNYSYISGKLSVRIQKYKKNSSAFASNILRFGILLGLIFIILYPFIFMFVTAFRGPLDIEDPGVVWITRHYTLDNFRHFFGMVNFPDIISYTLQICIFSAIFQTFVCGLVGYGFARFKFKGRGVLFGLLLFTMIVPPQTYILQLCVLFRLFPIPFIGELIEKGSGANVVNLINTPFPFIIQSIFGMGFRSGLFIYIYRQFFRGLPKELESAARIDGSSAMRTYFQVMLPSAIPSVVIVSMLSFVWNWNDSFSQSFLSMSKSSVAIFLSTIRDSLSSSLPMFSNPAYLFILIQTGALLCITPLILLFLFGQRFFTESVERTGIVG
jgi:multiple sugar transport system permease protein